VEQVQPGSRGVVEVGVVAQTIYTHISKCKNEEINGERKIKSFI
jgi:hypothetical protein